MYKIDDYHLLKSNTLVMILIGIAIIFLVIFMHKKINIHKTFMIDEEIKLKTKDYKIIKVNGKEVKKHDLLIKEKNAVVEIEYHDKLFTFIKEYIGEKYDRNKRRRSKGN